MSNGVDAWSFSRLQCYEECPAKFKYKFIDKLPEPKSDAMQRGIDIHKKCEDFLNGDAIVVDPELMRFGALFQDLREAKPMTEEQWALTSDWKTTGWFSKGKQAAWVRVILDAGVIYEDHTALVIDFKTGKPWGDNTDQMQLFGDVTLCRHPDLKEVETRLWYLDTGDEKVEVFKRKGLDDRLDYWEDRVEPMFGDTDFMPKPSNKCRWCAFSREKGGPCKY